MAAFLSRTAGTSLAPKERLSPLLAAAGAFAVHLNPPRPAPAVAPEASKPAPAAPVVRPPAATAKFTLRGTSCAADRPERSMALIWVPGASDHGRWVRQGAQVGHFLIQEVRPGSVIYVDGEQVREMAIERQAMTACFMSPDEQVRQDPGAASNPV